MPRPSPAPIRCIPALAGAALLLFLCLLTACSDSPSCGDADILCTVLGTGGQGFGGEGARPLEVTLYWPIDMVFDAEGRLLVLDWNNIRVRRLDHDGRVRTILGTGFEAEAGANGTPALEVSLHHTFSLAFHAGSGRLYLAGNHVPQILEMTQDELVWTIAGLLDPGYAGDGGPAVEASLDTPCGVAVAPSGTPIYVADTFNHCIRAIDAQGVIRTVAGDGSAGFSGDGGPALAARLDFPYRIRIDDATGDLYVCDVGNQRVRRIDAGGTITTVAGNGTAGFSGDGGPATEAAIHSALDARIGPDGALYIADTQNHRIRRVTGTGIMETVVGTGAVAGDADADYTGPALAGRLDHPSALLFASDGDMLIADTYASVLRRVRLGS